MYVTNQFRKGLKIEVEGIPFEIVDFQLVSPGKGGSFVRTKLKNLITQNVLEKTFKTGDKVERPDLQIREVQYLYKDNENYFFMDNKNYEQLILTETQMGSAKDFIMENILLNICLYKGKSIGVDLPNFVDLKVTKCDPGIKGDTVSGGGKPATLETGVTIQVPFHIKEGNVIKVDTRDSRYIEKVS